MNIYDFAGNFSEWTLESGYIVSSRCVYRSGMCDNESTVGPVYRADAEKTRSTEDIAFRCTIY